MVPRQPQLVIRPPGIVKQWVEEGNKLLAATVVLRNGSIASNDRIARSLADRAGSSKDSPIEVEAD